eukprot:TRINITY_DN5835_c0_g2_i1.p1 TRINITY_DN5835_c0_g2~~TRINITY_DN5835_c0_g2_i1.p1  ORF type:complete len:367 (+),score=74.88 TRINITY_DN5835_c0_g2_i1:155-1255(+)
MAVLASVIAISILIPNAALATETWDFTVFENELLPHWLDVFTINANTGTYSFLPNSTQSGVYGAADVLHVLFVVNQLNLTAEGRQEAANGMNQMQNSSGFFSLSEAEHHTGYQPWHATGYVNAAIKLVDGHPKYNNSYYRDLINTPERWQPEMDDLLNGPPLCSSIWSCGHKIAAMMAVPSMEGALDNQNDNATKFKEWYFQYLNSQADAKTGQWLRNKDWAPPHVEGLGGAFHLYFVYNWLDQAWPYPNASMTTSASMQGKYGGWSGSAIPGYMDIDGLYQTVRPAAAIGTDNAQAIAQRACSAFLPTLHKSLTSLDTLLGSTLAKNTHQLPALVGAVAECAKWFPDMVVTRRPWRQCLDYAPFI